MNPKNTQKNKYTTPKYIFRKSKNQSIIDHVKNLSEKNKSFNMIQNKKKISINDDVKYGEIEIELKIAKGEIGPFINMNGEDSYYHIYFNNNEEEIKRDYLTYDDNVSKIKIVIDYQVISFKKLFYNCECIESIYFKKFTRNNITNLRYMFYGCSNLKKIEFNNFNTGNATDMGFMFSDCSSLEKLDLSNFDTSKVTDMSYMFSNCSLLEELNLYYFNTKSLKDMSGMFHK